jgi:tripeptide aminopeptidase
MRKELLKEVLAIPTMSRQEGGVIKFLTRYAEEFDLICHRDQIGNVYMEKGQPNAGGHYPLVCAHTDSVHVPRPVKIVEENGLLRAVINVDFQPEPYGLGGDDKAGVFICLELLERQECLKAAFFMGEECFCIGSHAAEPEFFDDVGYCLEFDSPEGSIISFSSSNVQLFEENGAFDKIVKPLVEARMTPKWQNHPYTDVAILKSRFDFTCINLPAGYYYMHTSREYVKLSDVENAIGLGGEILDALGHKKYVLGSHRPAANPSRKVTGLVLEG